MVSILLTIVLLVLAFTVSKTIRNKFNIILVASIILSITLYILNVELVTLGFLGLAFFIVVMYGGAFPRKSSISKKIRAIRKEYSILGFVFLIPHAIEYLIEFLNGTFQWEWYGVIGFVIMIPLFITSFTYIKKTMNIKTWYKLQKWAYLVYLLIFVHLLLIGQAEHIPVYIVVFGLYSFLKLYNYVFAKTEAIGRVFLSVIVLLAVLLVSFKLTGTEPDELLSINVTANNQGIDFTSLTLEDGVYNGTGDGFEGRTVEVDVTVLDGEVTSIDIIQDGSTSSHHGVDFEQAAYDISDDIIEDQSTNIDTYSGATKTTQGVLEAVEDALNE